MINSTRINITLSEANAYINFNTDNNVSSVMYATGFDLAPNSNFSNFANGCENLVATPQDIFNGFNPYMNAIEDISNAFRNCYNLTGEPYITSNVYNASYAYANCNNLTGNPVIVESNHQYYGLNMFHMYEGCSNLTGKPVIPVNRKPQNMCYAYAECTNITGNPVRPIPSSSDYSPFNFIGVYKNCRNLTGGPVIAARAEDMSYAYYGCTNITGQPQIGNTNLCGNMEYAYYMCSSLNGTYVVPVNVINLVSAYEGCSNMKSSTIGLTTPEYGNGLVNMANCFKGKGENVYINIKTHSSNVWNNWLHTYGNSGENSITGNNFNWVNDPSGQRFFNMEEGILVYYNANFPPKPLPVGNIELNYFNLTSVNTTLTELVVRNMEG